MASAPSRDRQNRGLLAGTKANGKPKFLGGRTRNDIRYNALVLAEGAKATSILGAQFLDGRIDGYRLKGDGSLPRGKTRETARNFRTSPFQMFVWNGVLYVGAGEIDRVQAYRLNDEGLPRDRKPYAQTVRLRDTFPNAVIVAELAARRQMPRAVAAGRPSATLPSRGTSRMVPRVMRRAALAAFCAALVLLAPAHARKRRASPQLIQVLSPAGRATVSAHPDVNVVIRFTGGAAPGPSVPG